MLFGREGKRRERREGKREEEERKDRIASRLFWVRVGSLWVNSEKERKVFCGNFSIKAVQKRLCRLVAAAASKIIQFFGREKKILV